MLGAQVGELAMPYYIGVVIDMLGKGDIDGVAEISGYMAILLIVSILASEAHFFLIHKFKFP